MLECNMTRLVVVGNMRIWDDVTSVKIAPIMTFST